MMNEDPPDFDPDGDPVAPSVPGLWWGIVGSAVLGLILAAYLSAVSLTQRGVPLGCGEGSGCDEVFRSRWSSVAGLPVGIVASAAYAGVLACAGLIRAAPGGRQRIGWFGLMALTGAIAAAAVWFVGLQLVVLRTLCLWCLAEHALGLALLVLVIILWRRRRQISSSTSLDERESPTRLIPPTRGTAVGVVATLLLAALQMLVGGSGSSVARLPSGRNADTGPGPDRQVAVLGGDLVLRVRDLPHLGDPDAPHVLVLLFDYCCPHCRATHGFLAEGLERYPGQFVVVLLPMPLDADCNPTVLETEPRFDDACDLAKLALSVWKADPVAFPAFDAWLFEPEQPRDITEAQAHARQHVAALPLLTSPDSAEIAERIAADVEAYARSGAQTIPVLLSPGMDTVVGRTETAEELFDILEAELKLQAGPEAGE